MFENQELYFIIVIGIFLGLILVSFIVAMLVLYNRRQQRQAQEMAIVRDQYEKEVMQSQLEIQENTFKNISQELHDNIGQLLSVVKLSLSALPLEKEHEAYPLVAHSQQVLNKAILDLSDLTKSLYTDRITDLGLEECIRFELLTVKNAGLLNVQFSVTGTEFNLPEQKAIFLFRMFQEMLNNILKHSQATHVIAELTYRADQYIVMTVSDNGVGFNLDEVRTLHSAKKGVGLKSMYNRALLIGAEIEIHSEPDNGTRIQVKLSTLPNDKTK